MILREKKINGLSFHEIMEVIKHTKDRVGINNILRQISPKLKLELPEEYKARMKYNRYRRYKKLSYENKNPQRQKGSSAGKGTNDSWEKSDSPAP